MDWIREKIKAVRNSQGLSQEKMAELIGIEQTTYSNWETGKIDLTLKNIQRVADALKVDVKVFWDPEQFTNPNWKQHPDVAFSLEDKNDPMKVIDALRKRITILEEQNIAITRAYNELFEKKNELISQLAAVTSV